MTDRELRELKRRFSPEKCNISRIVGCYINSNKQIVYKINQSLGLGDSSVSERLLGVMKKALGGSIGVQQNEIEFSTHQVESGDEHKLLTALRSSSLRDAEALDRLYNKIADSLDMETSYAVLLANDVYDVYTRSSDGEGSDSTSVFSYIVCAICPVKDAPEALTFREADSLFHTAGADGILCSPEIGFTFPAFDGRATNIYGALYYTRSRSSSYSAFTEAIFSKPAPMPPVVQKANFSDALSSALGEECTLEVIKAVHAAVGEAVEAHKESRDPEPLTLTKHTIGEVLTAVGVDPDKNERFAENIDELFGKGANLTPKNVVAYNKFDLKMPEVKISVSPEYRDLVSVKEINGERHVTIKITGPVEVNGILLNTDGDE